MSEPKEAAARTARKKRATTRHANASRQPAPPATEGEDTVQRLAERSLREAVATVATHTPAEGTSPDETAVHQLRIAARRMRVWVRMFRSLLPAENARRLATELGWFGRELGTARDLDVYAAHLPSYVAEAGIAVDALGDYELDLERARSEARAALAGVFADPRLAALREDLGRTAAALAKPPVGPGTGPPTALARRRLRKAIKRLRKQGRAVSSEASVGELHELRIKAKKLRYELEFFAAIHPELAATAKSVKRMQDLLGELQDASVASANLERYALGEGAGSHTPPDGRQAFALGRLMQAQIDRTASVRSRFPAAWRTLDKELKSARKALAELE